MKNKKKKEKKIGKRDYTLNIQLNVIFHSI